MKKILILAIVVLVSVSAFGQKGGVVAADVDSLASGVIRDYQGRLAIIADKFVQADSVARIALVDKYNELSKECNAKVFDVYAKHIDKGEYYRQMVFNLRTMVDKSVVASVVKKIKGKDKTSSPYAVSLKRFVDNEQVAPSSNFVDFSATTDKGDEFKLSDIGGKDILLVFGVDVLAENTLSILKLLYSKADFTLIEVVAFSTTASDVSQLKAQAQATNMGWVNVSDFKGDNSPVVIDYNVVSLPTFVLIGKDGKVKFISQGMSQDVLVAFAK